MDRRLAKLKGEAMKGSASALVTFRNLTRNPWDAVPVAVHLLRTRQVPNSVYHDFGEIELISTCFDTIAQAPLESSDDSEAPAHITDPTQIAYFVQHWPTIWKWISFFIQKCVLHFTGQLGFVFAPHMATRTGLIFSFLGHGLFRVMMTTKDFIQSVVRLWLCSPPNDVLFQRAVNFLLEEASYTNQPHFIRQFVSFIADTDVEVATILLDRVDDGIICRSLKQISVNISVILFSSKHIKSLDDALLAKHIIPL
ncbi:hypothetical protein C8J56DRAFT_1050547 [Mycena floridula]|nr:hypothetical protein C8J56DRAFT_1050547 [Mycena floridula]